MIEKLKQSWRRFQLNDPGRRFQARYNQRRKSGHGMLRRAFFIGAGLVLLAVGIFFLLAPGPGLVIVFIAASLLARESLWLARVLDWADLGLRGVYQWSVKHWIQGSPALRTLVVLVTLIIFAGFAFGTYQLVFAS